MEWHRQGLGRVGQMQRTVLLTVNGRRMPKKTKAIFL